MKAANDIPLWTAFQQHDRSAERAIFHQFFKPLCLYSEHMVGGLEPAEDIVAEAFEKAWRRRSEFATQDNLKGFLYRVVRNASINHSIATRSHRQAHAQIEYMTRQDAEDANDPVMEREILRVELLQEIYEEIEELPGRCKEIFKMIFIQGLSTEHIGEQLGISPQTVRTQKARAIGLIRTQLLKKNRLVTLMLLSAVLGRMQ
jgi:RNA polymerase sigma-70 factor (family 1)